MRKNRPSLMVRKFLQHAARSKDVSRQHQTSLSDLHEPFPESGWPGHPFQKEYYFSYGTLMDPSMLAKVLQLSEPPKMRPSRVIGYQIKLWGPYPALLDGPSLHPVDRLACEILSEEQRDRLVAYEPDKYWLRSCLIDFLDGADGSEEKVVGAVFKWNGEPEELREGNFNLEEWLQKQKLNGS